MRIKQSNLALVIAVAGIINIASKAFIHWFYNTESLEDTLGAVDYILVLIVKIILWPFPPLPPGVLDSVATGLGLITTILGIWPVFLIAGLYFQHQEHSHKQKT